MFGSDFWLLSPSVASPELTDKVRPILSSLVRVEREMVGSEIIYHSRLAAERTWQFSPEEYSVFVCYLLLWPICFCVSAITLERFPLFTLIIPVLVGDCIVK